MIFFQLLWSSELRLFPSLLLLMAGVLHLKEVGFFSLVLSSIDPVRSTQLTRSCIFGWIVLFSIMSCVWTFSFHCFIYRLSSIVWFLLHPQKNSHLASSFWLIDIFLLFISSLSGYNCRIKKAIDPKYF